MATATGLDAFYAAAVQRQQEAERARLLAEEEERARLLAEHERTRGRTGGEVVQDVGVQLTQGVVGLGQSLYGMSNLATAGLTDRVFGVSEDFEQTGQILAGAKSAPTQSRVAESREIFDQQGIGAGLANYATDPLLLQDLAVSNITSIAPTALASRAAANTALRAATAPGSRVTGDALSKLVADRATTAGIRMGAAQTAGSVNVDAINTATRAGATDTEAQLAGIGAGVTAGVLSPMISRLTGAGALEAQVASRVFGGPGSGVPGSVARGVIGGTVREGTEEAAQSAVEQASVNMFAPGVDIGEGVGEAAAMGLLGGGMLGAPLGGYSAMGSVRRDTPLRQGIESDIQALAESSGVELQRPLATPPAPVSQEILDLVESQTVTPATGIGESQLLTAEEVASTQRAELLDSVAGYLFNTEVQPDGTVQYSRLNRELQVMETVPAEQALAEAAAAVDAAEAQTAPAPVAQVEELDVDEITATDVEPPIPLAQVEELDVDNIEGQPVLSPAARVPAPVVPAAQLQQFINERVGVDKPLTKADFVTAEDMALAELYTVTNDEVTGADTFSRYDPDTQSIQVIPAAEARRAAKALVQERQKAAAEQERIAAQPVITGWKQKLSKDLGLNPASLRGKDWDAFTAMVDSAGVRVGDPAADQFLQQIAPTLGANPASASLFAAKLSEKYDISAVQAPATIEAAKAATNTESSAKAPAKEVATQAATVAAESPSVADIAPKAEGGDVVPTNVPSGVTTQTADVVKASTRLQRIARRLRSEDENLTPERAMYEAITDVMYDASGATELDEMFGYIKSTPEFKTMAPADQDVATQVFSDLYDELETVGRFKRNVGTQRAESISREDFDSMLAAARVAGGRDVPIVGYQNAAHFRMATGRQAPNDVQGVYTDDGVIHMIRRNLADKKEFALVMAHERGHEGLRSLLGARLAPVVNRLYANAAMRTRLEAKRKELPGIDRITAGEEVLADMLAQGEKITGDVWSKLKAGASQTAARLLGFGDLRLNDADVDDLLTSTAAYIRGHEVNKEPKLADSLHNVSLDAIVGNPDALLESAVYSRAIAQLESLTQVNDEPATPTSTIGHVMAKATANARAAVEAVRNSGSGSTKLFRNMLHAVPLSQIDNLYSKHFDNEGGVNHLSALVQETRKREARNNQLLTRAKNTTYGDEKFKVSSLELAKEWETLGRNDRVAFNAVNAMQQYATLYSVWPDKAWADQSPVDYDKLGYTEVERRQAYQAIRKLWDKAGTQGQSIYKRVQADYKSQWGLRYEALASELSRTTGIPRFNADGSKNIEFQTKYGETIDASLNRVSSGPYSPLARYGDYFTVVRDAEGNTLEFYGSDSLQEAQARATAVRGGIQEGSGLYVTTAVRDEFIPTLDGLNHDLLNRFEQNVRNSIPADTDPDVVNGLITGLREAYLQSLPKHSLMQHANQRKGVQGFTLDAFRAYNDYTLKSAKATADYDHNGNISRAMLGMGQQVRDAGRAGTDADTTTMGQILEAVRAQRAAYLKAEYSPVADFLGKAGYIQYMTSPSQMVINAMQTPMVAIPRLAARFNSGGAIREAKNGLTTFIKSRGDMLGPKSTVDPETRRVLQRLQENGVLDFTLAHDMAGLADGGFNHMSGHWRGIMEAMSFAMHKSEVFNRQVTAYAAAKLASAKVRKDNNVRDGDPLPDELLELVVRESEQSVYDSHYDYSQSNKPTIMQGPYRKLLFQFQQYRVNALAMTYKDFRDSLFTKGLSKAEVASARRGLAWLLGMQLAFTGAAGTVMAPLVFAIMDMFRDDDDLLDSRTEFVRSAPQFIAHGVMSGVLDLGRLDSGSLLPYFGDRAYAPKDASTKDSVMYHLSQNLGPWVGLAGAWSEMANKLMEGEPVKAMEAGLPKPFSDAVKAVSGAGGVKDARDITYFDPGIWSSVAQAVGLRSGDRREAEELRGASYQLAKRVSTVKSRYIGRVVLGMATEDTDMVQAAYKDIAAWNEQYPDMAIKGADVRRAVVSQYRGQVLTDLYGVPTGRPLTQSALDALGI